MPIKLISAGGGSVSLNPDTTTSALNLTVPAENGTVITTGATSRIVPKAAMPSGAVLQVLNAVKTDVFVSSVSGSWFDIPGQGGTGTLSVTITPTSVTSKIFIMFVLNGGIQQAANCWFRLDRNGTIIHVGDPNSSASRSSTASFYNGAGGSHDNNYMLSVSAVCIDSPATTSAVTYKLQMYTQSGGTVTVLGRFASQLGSSADSGTAPAGSIVVMEVAQ
jgi:hypothetical protein